jgi:hypothetical protein
MKGDYNLELNEELFEKFEKINNIRRKQNPLLSEMDNIYNAMFPIKPLENMFKLGEANVLAWIKNDICKHLDKGDAEIFDYLIKEYKKDEVMKSYLDKMIKENIEE